jgi:hypothetical protein
MSRTIDGAHATNAESFLETIFFVKRMSDERIHRSRSGDGGIGLQWRLVLGTNLKVG